jgi:hypothetical protein
MEGKAVSEFPKARTCFDSNSKGLAEKHCISPSPKNPFTHLSTQSPFFSVCYLIVGRRPMSFPVITLDSSIAIVPAPPQPTNTPEPRYRFLIGCALIGIGLLRRKKGRPAPPAPLAFTDPRKSASHPLDPRNILLIRG